MMWGAILGLGLIRKVLFVYWTLAASFATAGLLDVPILATLRSFVICFASRGKTWEKNLERKGGLLGLSVPQSYFSHFYLVGVIWGAFVLYSAIVTRLGSWTAVVNLSFFSLHVFRRYLETVLLMSYPQDARMHVMAYVFGLSYYIAVPLSMLPESPPASGDPSNSASEVLSFPWISVGLGIFVLAAGFLVQYLSHRQLASLRKRIRAQQTKSYYAIPAGFLFEYVSCPHYFAEILIYTGFLMVGQCELLLCLLLWWVVANLLFAGRQTHQWYLNRFEEYPTTRKAIIPFLI
ncbi:hypothetical protein BSKO_04028 [Bryopsis sp. KO-2023]|nr:hypothetical protein BSKO_04028 [Bryopsis sp. KO-2023]